MNARGRRLVAVFASGMLCGSAAMNLNTWLTGVTHAADIGILVFFITTIFLSPTWREAEEELKREFGK